MSDERYVQELGQQAFDRQDSDLSLRCKHCWALPGQPHVAICPEATPEDQPVAPEPDQAALF